MVADKMHSGELGVPDSEEQPVVMDGGVHGAETIHITMDAFQFEDMGVDVSDVSFKYN